MRRWTTEDLERLKELISRRVSCDEMAKELGRTKKAIIKKAELIRAADSNCKESFSLSRKWSEQEKHTLAELASSRLSSLEISKSLGRSRGAVQAMSPKIGIELQASGGAFSPVREGITKGGAITVRVPPRIHRQFAELCASERKSMNQYLFDLILKEVEAD